MSDETLNFVGYRRSGLYSLGDLSSNAETGRLTASMDFVVEEYDANGTLVGQSAPLTNEFEIASAVDVQQLQSGAINRQGIYPAPNTMDAEPTYCVHLECRDTDLPWRYSPVVNPEAAQNNATLLQRDEAGEVKPWLTLLVGTEDELELLPEQQVRLKPGLLNDYNLAHSARWAHIQQQEGKAPIARILSQRSLAATTQYVAVLVPAFDASGQPAWSTPSQGELVLPRYFHWRFRTSTAGDFRTLARRLKAGLADPEMGGAALDYQSPDQQERFEIRGALAAIGSSDESLVADHPVLEELKEQVKQPQLDDRNRPITALPQYGGHFKNQALETQQWAQQANFDPRHRSVAGLGQWSAIAEQERISDAVEKQAGELYQANQRINQLAMGVMGTSNLFNRYLPGSAESRIMLFGPALSGLMTPQGSVAERLCASGRPLSKALFSSAARRVLRKGPARTSLALPNVEAHDKVLTATNSCPPPMEKHPEGLPHVDVFNKTSDKIPSLEDLLERALQAGGLPAIDIKELLALIDFKNLDKECQQRIIELFRVIIRLQEEGKDVPVGDLAELLKPLLRSDETVNGTNTGSGSGVGTFSPVRVLPSGVRINPGTIERRNTSRRLRDLLASMRRSSNFTHVVTVDGGTTIPDIIPVPGVATGDSGSSDTGGTNSNDEPSGRECIDLKKLKEILDAPHGDDGAFLEFVSSLFYPMDEDPCQPVDLDVVDEILVDAFDPSRPDAFIRRRVLDTIEGLEDDELKEAEPCFDIDWASWTFLRDRASHWLLPGVDKLQPDEVVAFQTNPNFIASYLLGINNKAVEELRWRNIPLKSACSPVKMFWGRVDPILHKRGFDINPIGRWSNEPLGHEDHQAPGAEGNDLVVVIQSELFKRYPRTVISLQAASLDGQQQPDWEADPNDGQQRILPQFMGSIREDITFFGFDITPDDARKYWFVLEEPPSGYRFRNASDYFHANPDDEDVFEGQRGEAFDGALSGAFFARAAINEPTVVLIRGDAIIPHHE
ncbi:MAG: hypothetical protein RPU34_07640 [Candidatus Sedimenticola sp. (ex Thyasira tokunagai)]